MRSDRLIGIILITCVILLIAIYVFREGYRNVDNSDAAALAAVYESQKNANAQKQDDFVKSRLQNYNPIGMALTTAGTQGNLGNSTRPLMGTAGNSTGIGGNERVNNLPLSTGKTGVFDMIAKCEAVNTADCSAFDNPEFATNCGICLDLGPSEAQATNSNNIPSIGGRYLSSDDREQAEDGVTGNVLPDYTPTFGTCPAPKRMAGTKAQCLRIKRQMECEKAANYDKPNCVQCFGDGNYSIVDPALSPRIFTGSGTLVIFGEGIMNFNEIGYQKKDRIILSKTNGVRITLQGPEMTRITISVTPVDDSSPEPSIGGYITGVTTSGEFVVDMKRILLDDAATGRKPLTGGSMNVDGTYVAKIVTGFAQTQIALNAQVPFTFVDPLTQEGAKCSSSPYVTTQAAAEFLGSNPCYKKGSGPGKYSLECLQNIFLSNGGLQSGKGYPKDETLASPLMYDGSGKARSLNDIATYIYGLSIIAATGVDMYGNKQTIENWSAASVFCTGKEVSTPCDTGGRDTGPLNDECLTYLWDNMGSSNSLGGTYSGISMAKSMFNSGNNARFCQRSGTLSPVDANGKKNRTAIEYWRKQGGVSKVKEIMKTIHEMANNDDEYAKDEDRIQYISQCYGEIPMAPRPSPVTFDLSSCPKTGCGTMARYVRFWTSTDRLQISQIMIFDIYRNNLALNSKPKMLGTYPVFGTKVEDTINGSTNSGCCGVIGEGGHYGMIEYDLGKPCDIISVLFFQQQGRTQVGGRIALANLSFNDPNGRTEIISKTINSEKSPIKFSFVTSNPSAECLKCIQYCPYPEGSDMIGQC